MATRPPPGLSDDEAEQEAQRGRLLPPGPGVPRGGAAPAEPAGKAKANKKPQLPNAGPPGNNSANAGAKGAAWNKAGGKAGKGGRQPKGGAAATPWANHNNLVGITHPVAHQPQFLASVQAAAQACAVANFASASYAAATMAAYSTGGKGGLPIPPAPPDVNWNEMPPQEYQPTMAEYENEGFLGEAVLSDTGQRAAFDALQRFRAVDQMRDLRRKEERDQEYRQAVKPKQLPTDPEEYEKHRRVLAEKQARETSEALRGQFAEYDISVEPKARAKAEPTGGGINLVAHAMLEPGRRFSGRIKSWSMVTGFGFIQCPELKDLFGGDVFLNVAVEGGPVKGGQVEFSLEVTSAGKPQARNVVLVDATPVQSGVIQQIQVPVDDFYVGKVKSYNQGRGFGFLTVPALYHSFAGKDVYMSATQVPEGLEIRVGMDVRFRLAVDKQGNPQAKEVRELNAPRLGGGERGPPGSFAAEASPGAGPPGSFAAQEPAQDASGAATDPVAPVAA